MLETQGQFFGHTGGDTKIIGGEFAGEVVQLGEGVDNLKIGDNVRIHSNVFIPEFSILKSNVEK